MKPWLACIEHHQTSNLHYKTAQIICQSKFQIVGTSELLEEECWG